MEAFVRLFFEQGSLSDLQQAYCLDPEGTARLLFYWRDRNRGLGQRTKFHLAYTYLVHQDSRYLHLLPQIPVYGCWKDLVILAGMISIAVEPIAQLFAQQLQLDQVAMRAGKYISTAAKWFPSSHAKHGRTILTQRVQVLLAVTEEGMRRTFLTPLRYYLQLAEVHLSTRQPINYRRITKGAIARYTQVFRRNDATWQPRTVIPRSVLDVVTNVLEGKVVDADKYWNRYCVTATARGVAVVCDTRTVIPAYPIAFALAVATEGIYTFTNPSVLVTIPPEASLPLKIATLQKCNASTEVSLVGITAPCIIVLTSQPIPTPLPLLAPNQRLIWWREGTPVAVIEHGVYCIEICGFVRKLFSVLAKGHIPSLAHIVAGTLNKYTSLTIDNI